MRKRDHSLLTNAASLLICGLLAGVVVAAAAFPAVAMSGLAAKAGAETFDKLPSELTVKRPPQMTYVYANDGKTLLATFYDENRKDIPLKEIPPIMQKAIIAAEDHGFYQHNGVDAKGIARAFVANNSAGETTQGASTLTMQYVRLAIAYSATHPEDVVAATEDTSARKLREMRYALQLDKEFSKDEILERYLNIAPFGNGAYGVYAASQVYFGKAPKNLKIEEAAMLAGMVKAPSAFNPTTPGGKDEAKIRRDYVIDNMAKIGAITQKEADTAKATPLKVTGKRAPNGCVQANNNLKYGWGFFCDYVYRWWMEQETFGATSYDRERRLKSGGYSIISSLDAKTQNAAKKNVEAQLKTGSKHALMVAAVEPGTGRVRALAVNRYYKLDDSNKPQNKISSNPAKAKLGLRGTYPNTTNPLMTGGGDITGYQAGSTFKIFTMVAALERGYPLAYTINARSPMRTNYIVEQGAPAACGGTHFYCPTNANPSWMNGSRTMWSGFGRSVNTYFVKLQEEVGAENAVAVAKKLGIKFRAGSDAQFANNKDAAHQWGAFTLGVSGTTPLDLANAYATLAADGKYCEPIPVQEIRDQDGKKLDVANPRCNQAVKPEVARSAIDAARCPVGDNSPTDRCDGGTAPEVRSVVKYPVAGKTGTTDGEKTASLVVTTKQLAVAGILADPDWAQTTSVMDHNKVNPAVYRTLRDGMKGKPKVDFTPPNGKIVEGDQRSIPDVTCVSIETARSRIEGAGFQAVVDNNPVTSSCPKGTAAGTSPSGRTIKGGTVTIQVSEGKGGNNGGQDRPSPPGRPGRGNNG
ncbi:Membrane carboxypeptidase (penicillin-binding protein) [Micromonospora pattaloongensis]|uniref:Membrane carboxypeptidase (Penicillin-binding protein) n=1 Tax=Micromonospora pattaloongensis TaxID=405436 RepID=A0A1H3HDC8_9ACTN|nr:transglycosylase domain-containing protein [Micromonospora pattaloongensis]SDY13340.1 Membrane carboxypeptidase (penicillin-binding protein) [Micromonospora pattaloongensis]